MLWKPLLVHYWVVVWECVFSIFCNTSFGDYTHPQHQETTFFPHTSPLHINVMFISGCEHFHHVFHLWKYLPGPKCSTYQCYAISLSLQQEMTWELINYHWPVFVMALRLVTLQKRCTEVAGPYEGGCDGCTRTPSQALEVDFFVDQWLKTMWIDDIFLFL